MEFVHEKQCTMVVLDIMHTEVFLVETNTVDHYSMLHLNLET